MSNPFLPGQDCLLYARMYRYIIFRLGENGANEYGKLDSKSLEQKIKLVVYELHYFQPGWVYEVKGKNTYGKEEFVMFLFAD